jgi:hypothetical protein
MGSNYYYYFFFFSGLSFNGFREVEVKKLATELDLKTTASPANTVADDEEDITTGPVRRRQLGCGPAGMASSTSSIVRPIVSQSSSSGAMKDGGGASSVLTKDGIADELKVVTRKEYVPRWDGCRNIHVGTYELATEYQHMILCFNTNTNAWVAK